MVTELNILLNNFCNYRCTYCSFKKDDKSKNIECSKDHLKKAISLFFDNLIKNHSDQGLLCFNADGEVFLSNQLLFDGIDYAYQLIINNGLKNILIAVVTNGSIITDEIAEKLKKYHVAVTISIDGNKNENDKHRLDPQKKSTFYKTVRGIKKLKKNDIPVSLRAVFTNKTIKSILDSYYFLNKLEPSLPVKLRPVRDIKNLSFTDSWIKIFSSNYIRCIKHLIKKKVNIKLMPDDAYHFANYIVNNIKRESYCSAGKNMFWMMPDGYFYSCGLFTDKNMNVGFIDDLKNTKDFNNLLNHHNSLKFINKNIKCLTCEWVNACGGGCPALFLTEKSETQNHPLCELYLELGKTLKEHFNKGKF